MLTVSLSGRLRGGMKARDLPVVDEDAGTVAMLAAMRAHEADAVLVRDGAAARLLTADEVMEAHNAAVEQRDGQPVRLVRARDIASWGNHRIVSAPDDVRQLVVDADWNLIRGSEVFPESLTLALNAGFSRTGATLMSLDSDGVVEQVVTDHESTITWSGQCDCAGPDPDVHYFRASETKSFPVPGKCKYFHRAKLNCS